MMVNATEATQTTGLIFTIFKMVAEIAPIVKCNRDTFTKDEIIK